MPAEYKRVTFVDGVNVTPPSSTVTVPVMRVFDLVFTASVTATIDVNTTDGLNAQKCAIVAIYRTTGDYVDVGLFTIERPSGSTTTLRVRTGTARTETLKAIVIGSP